MGSGAATWCFPDFLNLAFHEAGHVFARPFGSTIQYLGGTLGQLFVPSLLIGYFVWRTRQPLAAAVSAWWLGESFVNVSIYMADARELALPLVGGGDHDWNELFFRFGVLDQPAVTAISNTTHVVGTVVMAVGLCWVAYFVAPDHVQQSVHDEVTARFPWAPLLLPSPTDRRGELSIPGPRGYPRPDCVDSPVARPERMRGMPSSGAHRRSLRESSKRNCR
jgi:hypothetical protein